MQAQEKLAIENGLPIDHPDRQKLSAEMNRVRFRLAVSERDLLPASEPASMDEIQEQLRPGEVMLLYGWWPIGATMVLLPATGN